jgi:hypothetical protein
MSLSSFIQKRLRLPSRIALLLGLGALSAAGARAETTASHNNSSAFGDVQMRLEGGHVFVSERNGEFRRLGDSAETRLLIQLLENDASAAGGVRPPMTKLAGAGGSGFHWAPADTADTSRKASSTAQSSTRKAVGTTAPPQHKNAAPKTTPGSSAQKE